MMQGAVVVKGISRIALQLGRRMVIVISYTNVLQSRVDAEA